jgi:hypothetical protein
MLDAIAQKQVMNGSVPEILLKPKQDKINEQTKAIRDIFYKGD